MMNRREFLRTAVVPLAAGCSLLRAGEADAQAGGYRALVCLFLFGGNVEDDGFTVRVRPELVVEIAYDGLQRSTRYPAGVALRFARVLRHRPDKSAAEADTIEQVLAAGR
jgi:ATP-dependent DNA ligase